MLKHSSGYTLKKVGNSWYLLPFGQQVADQHKAVVLNETGAFLWNTLEHTSDLEELTHHLARYYEVPESTCPELREDVQTFFRQLLSFGILEENLAPKRRDDTLNLEIAGLLLRLNGPASLFPKEFSAFASEKSELPDQDIDLVTLPPSPKANGTVLLRNPELTVMEAADRYVFLFPTMKNIREASMTKDGSYVRISCAPTSTEENLANLFHAIRLFFLFLAQKRGRFALHSASLLYQGKAWLFSGHSGMGKSTHTNLWHELFQTPLLNGDLNLLGQKDGRFLVYGLPWCGTSEIFTTETRELGGIVLLGRDPEKDFIQELSAGEKTVRVMQRLISPCWSEEQLSENLAFSEALAENLPVLSFLCTKNPSAACTMKEEIDRIGGLLP